MSRDYPDIIQTNSTDGAAATREFRVERKVDVLTGIKRNQVVALLGLLGGRSGTQ